MKVSSIPAKYENVIFRNSSQPAFGDSKERFFRLSSNKSFVPGPGQYDGDKSSTHIYSKKGSGSFASATKLQRL